MSYKDIPEVFQPISIANNKYTFSDGVYSTETDRIVAADEVVVGGTLTRTLTLVANDDTATEPDPPRYINGVRRVRNVCADVDFVVVAPAANTYVTVSWIVDIIVLRQGQLQAFTNDVIATRCGVTRAGAVVSTITDVKDEEEFSICYPGYVDLCGGDTIVVRISAQEVNNHDFYYCLGLGASALVRFG